MNTNNYQRIIHVCMCDDSQFHPATIEDVIEVLNAHQRNGVEPITPDNAVIKFDC